MPKEDAPKIGSLSNFGALRDIVKVRKMDQVSGIPLTILDFEKTEGNFGEYILIDVVKADGEKLKVSCSGTLIISALNAAKEAGALPLTATFLKRGNTWIAE